MHAITTNHILQHSILGNLKMDTLVKAVSSAYHIKRPDGIHCFVLTNEPTDKELEGSYSVYLIDGKTQLIYDFELTTPDEPLLLDLFRTMKNENDEACFSLISQFGYAAISEFPNTVERNFSIHGLENALPDFRTFLNKNAIDVLKRINLGIVPPLYNWLMEAEDSGKFKQRCQALLRFPILLSTRLRPSKFSTIPPSTPSKDILKNNEIKQLTRLIDEGVDAAMAISQTLGYPLSDLKYLEWKLYWQVGLRNDEEIHAKYESEIKSYEYYSKI